MSIFILFQFAQLIVPYPYGVLVFLQFSISIWNSPYFSFGRWKDRLPTVGGLNIETDFHRIYGVIFCALLHREATEYLLFVGTTMICFHDNACSHIVGWAYDHLIGNQAQAHDSDAEQQSHNSYYALYGWFVSAHLSFHFFELVN